VRNMKKKTLKKKCDALWSEIVKIKANYKCEYTMKHKCSATLNSHHIYGRAAHSTRFDIDNGICVCYNAHKIAEQSPRVFYTWLESYRGTDKLDEIERKHNKLVKLDYGVVYDDLLNIKDMLLRDQKPELTD
jgi:hypothetical protein